MERITNYWYFGIVIVFTIAELLHFVGRMIHEVKLRRFLGVAATPADCLN